MAKYLCSKESGCSSFTNITAFLAALPNKCDFVHGDTLEEIYTAHVTAKALGPCGIPSRSRRRSFPIQTTAACCRTLALTYTQLLRYAMDTSVVHVVRAKQQTVAAIFFVARTKGRPFSEDGHPHGLASRSSTEWGEQTTPFAHKKPSST